VFGTVVAASDAVDTIGSTECSVEPPEVEGEWVAAEVVGGGADGTDVVAAGGDVLWTGSDGSWELGVSVDGLRVVDVVEVFFRVVVRTSVVRLSSCVVF
jgi:hypothetical protein